MKKLFRILYAFVCAFTLAVAGGTFRLSAEEGDEVPVTTEEDGYGYTVTFLPGDQGTLNGTSEIKDIPYGGANPVTVDGMAPDVDLGSDSKYYAKGWHVAGTESRSYNAENQSLDTNTFTEGAYEETITKDVIYVMTYGVKGDLVAYTVEYLNDADGSTLAPAETFYGNPGDKPVLPYLYVEGYQPQAYNLTGTLDADASKNVFQFRYKKTPASGSSGSSGTTVRVVQVDGTITYVQLPAPAGRGGGGGTGTGGAGGAGGAAGGAAGGNGAPGGVIDDNTEPQTTPETIIDIDDTKPTPDTTPTPGSEGGGNGEVNPPEPAESGLGTLAKLGLAAGGGILLLLLLMWLLRRREKENG